MEDEHGSALDTLETRLADIERRVYGRSNPSHRETEDAADGVGGGIVPRLTDISKEVGSAIGARERLAPLLRRLTELDEYIDPSFGESKGLPADIKVEIILSQEEKIRKSSVTLTTIQEKSSVLNDDAILAYTQLESNANIMKLSAVQLDQEEACSRLNEVGLELIERYNDVISTIAETFVRYDEILTALEEGKRVKASTARS